MVLAVTFSAIVAVSSIKAALVTGFGILLTGSVAAVVLEYKRRRDKERGEGGAIFGSVMPTVLDSIGIPSMICDNTGKILWCSTLMTQATGQTVRFFGASIENTLGVTIQSISESEDSDKEVRFADKLFSASSLKLDNASGNDAKSYFLVSLTDRTNEDALRRRYESERVSFAYIMIDNINELSQLTNDSYSQAGAEIEAILRAWAADINAVIKSYDRDRYVLILQDSRLDECIENKFEILDRIRAVRAGDSGMSVTVSMGVAKTPGSLDERDKAARAALDLALQRGGDQAVLRTADQGDLFFGGRTKTVQKRDSVRARVIVNKLCAAISTSSNVVIMGHRGADLDSIGSAVGVARLARFCGVKANIVIDPEDSNIELSISKFKNVSEYSDTFIDSNAAMNLAGADTLLVLTDVNAPSRAEAPDFAENAYRTVVIDHHRKIADIQLEAEIEYIDPSASSACELVTEMLQQCLSPGELLREEANALYAGMLLDTHQFSRNTGTRTFGAALYLRSEGASPADVQNFFRSNLDELAREARFETGMQPYRANTLIALYDGEGEDSDRIIAAKVADKLLKVQNVKASFALVEIDGVIHVSARSDGNVNVQLIMERLGGGGYFQAAGAQLQDMTSQEAIEKLKAAIDEYIDEKQ